MDRPYFSIAITAFNREAFIKGCIESCLNQTFTDYEIVVVDDGSTDNTVKVLEQIKEPRLRIIKHPQNMGICPANHTAVKNAVGKWVVGIDSDWALLPNCLQRLYEVTSTISDNILVVRARVLWDTGKITPSFVPKEPIDYIGRITWAEKEGGSDALMCSRRAIFEKVIYEPKRRIKVQLFQLSLAQQGLILYIEDVLCKEYSSAPNSITRGSFKSRINFLRSNASDMLWMFEEILRLHGPALKKYGPVQYQTLYRNIALQNFYLGNRWQGTKAICVYLRKRPFDLVTWSITILGLVGPKAAIYGNAIRHWLRGNPGSWIRYQSTS